MFFFLPRLKSLSEFSEGECTISGWTHYNGSSKLKSAASRYDHMLLDREKERRKYRIIHFIIKSCVFFQKRFICLQENIQECSLGKSRFVSRYILFTSFCTPPFSHQWLSFDLFFSPFINTLESLYFLTYYFILCLIFELCGVFFHLQCLKCLFHFSKSSWLLSLPYLMLLLFHSLIICSSFFFFAFAEST